MEENYHSADVIFLLFYLWGNEMNKSVYKWWLNHFNILKTMASDSMTNLDYNLFNLMIIHAFCSIGSLARSWFLLLRIHLKQFKIKTRWGITSVSFGLTYHFPDFHHIHENSAETLVRKHIIVNLLKNTKIWSFLCQYHSLAQRWTLLLKSHVFGIIRK